MGLEALARSMGGNLTQEAEAEREIDRLRALALGSSIEKPQRESLLNSLGVSLIGFKHKGRADLHVHAKEGLRDCLGWRSKMGRGQREKIAEAAIQEWVMDMCWEPKTQEGCKGAREIFDGLGVRRPCHICHGSGKRRYSDAERPFGNRHMDAAHFLISFSVAVTIRSAIQRLEK